MTWRSPCRALTYGAQSERETQALWSQSAPAPRASTAARPIRLPGTTPSLSAAVARRVESAGIAKAGLPALQTLVLGILAGAFIAFGAMTYAVVVTGSELGFGPTRLLGGLAFSLGLILVVVGGAELFTGNNLIAMAWADRRITSASSRATGCWSTPATSPAPSRR